VVFSLVALADAQVGAANQLAPVVVAIWVAPVGAAKTAF